MENRWADHFSHWPIVWPPPAVSRFSRSRRHGRREKTTLNFPMNIPNGNQSSSTPIARTRRSPSFSFVFLSLLSPFHLSISLADPQSRVAHSPWWSARSRARRRYWCRSHGCRPPSCGDLRSRWRKDGTFVLRRFATTLASAGGSGDSLPSLTREEQGKTEKRGERNGSSRNTDAARVVLRSHRWRRLQRDVTNRNTAPNLKSNLILKAN